VRVFLLGGKSVISWGFLAFFFLLPSRGERIAIAQRGQMFGELGLLGLTETGRRMRSAVSITECELLRMSKQSLQILILAQNELLVAYRQLAQRFVCRLDTEAADPKSPIHDLDKLVHIYGSWQKDKIPDDLRIQGKVLPPTIDSSQEEEKSVTTTISLKLLALSDFPMLHMAKGGVSVRFIISYDVGGLGKESEVRTVLHEATLKQGKPLELDFSTLLKYRHGLDAKEAIVHRKDITIKVVYLKWIDHAPGAQLAVSAHLGYEQPAQDGVQLLPSGSESTINVGTLLPAPNLQTVIGVFTVKLKDLVNTQVSGDQIPPRHPLSVKSTSPQEVHALNTVTINRNPGEWSPVTLHVNGAQQTGIGITFGRRVAKTSGFVFDALDHDEDGIITREEYNAGFDTMDLNKNGKISVEEFNCEYFSMLDKDGDGKLSREEYEAGFDMIDTDKDGEISRLEFLASAGPYLLHNISPEGTAYQSGLLHVGDLLYKVNEVSVLDLTAEQVTALILGEPSSPINLTISTQYSTPLASDSLSKIPPRPPIHGYNISVLQGAWGTNTWCQRELSAFQDPMELTIATKVSRELPTNSVVRSVFRQLWQKKRQKEHDHELGRGECRTAIQNLSDSKARMKKTVRELKTGICNMLIKGDSGKSAAQAASFEMQMEKSTENLIKRLRELKQQINTVFLYNQNFELHMNEEMKHTLDCVDKRIDSAMEMHVLALPVRASAHQTLNCPMFVLKSNHLIRQDPDSHFPSRNKLSSIFQTLKISM
jgi:hypothetical protein